MAISIKIWTTGVAVIVAVAGCGPTTAHQKLVGRWKGTPRVTEAVDQAVNAAAQGKPVNQLARGAAQFLGGLLAANTMSVDLDLRDSGAAFVQGNAEVLGLPPDSVGTWKVLSEGPDVIQIQVEVDQKQLQAQIFLRDADEFTLKSEILPDPSDAKSDPSTGATTKAEPNPPSSALTSSSDATPPDTSAHEEKPASPRAVSIVFKRNKGQ